MPVNVPYIALALSVGGESLEGQEVSKGLRISEVDDRFFNLSDMEQYLEQAEQLSDPGIWSHVSLGFDHELCVHRFRGQCGSTGRDTV